MTDTHKYLTPESLDEYFTADVPTQHLLCETPYCLLRIEPAAERLTFRTLSDGTAPTVKGLERVTVDIQELDGTMWSVVEVDAREMHQPAYALAVSIAEEMRKRILLRRCDQCGVVRPQGPTRKASPPQY